jgi:hypothetical protein
MRTIFFMFVGMSAAIANADPAITYRCDLSNYLKIQPGQPIVPVASISGLFSPTRSASAHARRLLKLQLEDARVIVAPFLSGRGLTASLHKAEAGHPSSSIGGVVGQSQLVSEFILNQGWSPDYWFELECKQV